VTEISFDAPQYYRRRRGFEPILFAGLFFTALLHGGAVGLVLYLRHAAANATPPPDTGSYVVAKLVRLGKKRDPKQLPDKIVPREATVKAKGVSYDAEPDDKPRQRKKHKDAKLSDRMRSALDRAAALSNPALNTQPEGDPNGVVGGTATKAGAGDVYMTRIADLWNRTWSLPSIIPREQAKKLFVKVVIEIDKTGKIKLPITFTRKSGNDHFDASVSQAWQRIKRLPLPPGDRLAAVLANGLKLKLNWKGLR